MNKGLAIAVTALLFALHAVEEFVTGFHSIDLSVRWLAATFSVTPLVAWLSVQVALTVFLLILTIFRARRVLWAMLVAVICLEVSHPVLALQYGAYYPGLFTSFLFLPLGWLVFRAGVRSERL